MDSPKERKEKEREGKKEYVCVLRIHLPSSLFLFPFVMLNHRSDFLLSFLKSEKLNRAALTTRRRQLILDSNIEPRTQALDGLYPPVDGRMRIVLFVIIVILILLLLLGGSESEREVARLEEQELCLEHIEEISRGRESLATQFPGSVREGMLGCDVRG